jgi:hypothetical protein
VTGFRWLTAIAFGLIFAAGPSLAVAFDSKAARTTCNAQYEREKEGGTIPAGMAKSKYVTQCVNGMRRTAELEQELSAGSATKPGTPAAGSNEITVSTTTTPATTKSATRTGKPATVATPAFAQTKGQ